MQSYKKVKSKIDSKYTYHYHTRHDKSSSSKRVHEEKEKVHDEAKEIHWKCIQENEKGQWLTSSSIGQTKERHVWLKQQKQSRMMWSQELMAGKGEKLYKQICEAMNKSDQIDQGSSSSDDVLDYSVLYAKV
jgi:hypothetical protein